MKSIHPLNVRTVISYVFRPNPLERKKESISMESWKPVSKHHYKSFLNIWEKLPKVHFFTNAAAGRG